MILHYIFIGCGGALGAIMRTVIGELLPITILGISSPILLVNIIGCFAIGFLTEIMTLYWPISVNMKYFLISGFLGGFTTFSSFILEFGLFVEKNEYIYALSYAFLSFLLSAIGFFAAVKIVRLFL
ncbi:MAG: CrcB family protein [Rickettsiaceae bacterium]|nr:CrcB family protein [Rickettsiaceae bacterium]